MAHCRLFQALKDIIGVARYSKRNALTEMQIADLLYVSKYNYVNVKRREIIKGTMGVAGLYGLLSMFLPALAHNNYGLGPIAVIGAGLSGLTAAFRLMQAGVRVHLYEAHPYRYGGRVWTKRNFNYESMFCELGGELVSSNHDDLRHLCNELNIQLQPLKQNHEDLLDEFYFIDGKFRSEIDILRDFEPLAKIIDDDIAFLRRGGDDLQIPTYRNPLNAESLDSLSLKEWLDAQQGKVEGWVLRLMEIAYVGEMGADASEQSALNLLLIVGTDTQDGFKLYGESDEALRIKGGNDRLTSTIFRRLDGNIPIYMDHRLIAIRDINNKLRLTFSVDGNIFDRKYDRVILAMPFTMLRQVDGIFDLSLSDTKKKCIAEMGMGSNAKFMLGFRKRFWRKQSANIQANQGEFFSDVSNAEFWETSRAQSGRSGIITAYFGGKNAEISTKQGREQVLRQIEYIWPDGGLRYLDDNQAFMSWYKAPYQLGSYSTLLTGQWTSIYGSAGESEMNGRLIFAGEQASENFSGFMNGAVEAGNRAALEVLA